MLDLKTFFVICVWKSDAYFLNSKHTAAFMNFSGSVVQACMIRRHQYKKLSGIGNKAFAKMIHRIFVQRTETNTVSKSELWV